MIQEILGLALNSGLWAAMFCLLFFYQLKDSKEREKRYVSTIDTLMEGLGGIQNIGEGCDEIRDDCREIKAGCDEIRADCDEIKSGCREIKNAIKEASDEF